jgi:hypothetical protein
MGHHLDVDCCEYCGEPLPPRAATGRRRRFCCDAHRRASGRERRAALGVAPDPDDVSEALNPGEPVKAFLVGQAASPDDQVLAAVHETLLLIVAYRRLGVEARRQFAWRCAGMAGAIEEALARYFRKVNP